MANTSYYARISITQQKSWRKKKVEALSTSQRRKKKKKTLTNHIAKILSYDANKHDIKHMQMETTHTTNHSRYELSKYSGVN